MNKGACELLRIPIRDFLFLSCKLLKHGAIKHKTRLQLLEKVVRVYRLSSIRLTHITLGFRLELSLSTKNITSMTSIYYTTTRNEKTYVMFRREIWSSLQVFSPSRRIHLLRVK